MPNILATGYTEVVMWSKQEDEILKENYNRTSAKKMQGMLQKKTIHQIYHRARKLGLVKEPRWTQDELDTLKFYFNVETKKNLESRFPNRSWKNIVHMANSIGLKRTEVVADFSKIETEEQAYLLGFIAADGYIRHSDPYRILCLAVAEQDLDILEKTRNYISPRHKLRYQEGRRSAVFPRGGVYDTSPQYHLDIGSKKLVHQLEKLGLHQNKSLTLVFPDYLESRLVRHWIRGYFDGDGSITKGRQVVTTLVGTENVISSIQGEFSIIYRNRCNYFKRGNIFYLTYSGGTAEEFLNWIYAGSTFHLDRKYNKAKPFLKAE